MFGNDHNNQSNQADESTVTPTVPVDDSMSMDSPSYLPDVNEPVAPTPTPVDDSAAPVATSDEPAAVSVPTPTPTSRPAAGSSVPGDLMSIKAQALQSLSPLVGHLDQSPEERFKTFMMMIQASDDQSMIKDAYESAQAITDEKVKAQALLDVVNEINYFTQQQDN